LRIIASSRRSDPETSSQFQGASKQSEAKANLKAVFTAQKAFFQEKDLSRR